MYPIAWTIISGLFFLDLDDNPAWFPYLKNRATCAGRVSIARHSGTQCFRPSLIYGNGFVGNVIAYYPFSIHQSLTDLCHRAQEYKAVQNIYSIFYPSAQLLRLLN